MLQENKYPPSQVVFVVHLALIILSWCEYMKLCIFTSVCMTHASVIAAWISLSGFLFGVFDLVCELLMLLLSIKDCSSSHTSLPAVVFAFFANQWNVGGFFFIPTSSERFLHLPALFASFLPSSSSCPASVCWSNILISLFQLCSRCCSVSWCRLRGKHIPVHPHFSPSVQGLPESQWDQHCQPGLRNGRQLHSFQHSQQ